MVPLRPVWPAVPALTRLNWVCPLICSLRAFPLGPELVPDGAPRSARCAANSVGCATNGAYGATRALATGQ